MSIVMISKPITIVASTTRHALVSMWLLQEWSDMTLAGSLNVQVQAVTLFMFCEFEKTEI